MSKSVKFCLIALFLSLISFESFGQASLVPSYHPVYEWLYMQRIKGSLPYYDYESLPLNRKDILGFLEDLNQNPDYKTGKEARTLKSFLSEFNPSHLEENSTHSLITNNSRLSFDRFKDWIWSDNEKHIYSYKDSSSFLVFDYGYGVQSMFVNDDEKLSAPYISNQNLRSYAAYQNIIGYHIEFIGVVPNSGDQNIFQYDGFYSYNWKSLTPSQNIRNNYHYEAYVTGDYSFFEASIGRGNLKEGVGRTENLVLSRSSIPFDWLKLKIGKEKIRYSYTHGSLSWPAINSTLPGDSTISTRNSPRRWLAYHKVTIQPSHRFSIAVYEMINYSNRGAEIAYINPVNRYPFAEWELQDQDNGWVGAYILARPLNFIEIYTELLIDDLGNKKDIFLKKVFPETSRFARRYGLSVALKSDIQFWGEYTRLDPFIYSHPRDLNAHTDKGIGLGSQIGPNADRSEVGVKVWGTGRSYLSVSYSYNRKGLDEFDSNGNRIFLAGASPNDGRDLPITRTNLFLDGELHKWHRYLIKGSLEPKRGYIIEVHFDVRKMVEGNQIHDQAIFWANFTVGI